MKLLFLLFVTLVIAVCVYSFLSKKFKKTNNKKFRWIPLGITALGIIVMLSFIAFGMYKSATAPDTQCISVHKATSNPPISLHTATDYFTKGNYDYDIGNCPQAVEDYTNSIKLNPHLAQAYNNRAYTYMRMQDYKAALPDLDKAIQLKPDYVQALMNRGDIHNYYYKIDKAAAIADYQKVISLVGPNRDHISVCGHLFLAKHNGWNLGTVWGMLNGESMSCR